MSAAQGQGLLLVAFVIVGVLWMLAAAKGGESR